MSMDVKRSINPNLKICDPVSNEQIKAGLMKYIQLLTEIDKQIKEVNKQSDYETSD